MRGRSGRSTRPSRAACPRQSDVAGAMSILSPHRVLPVPTGMDRLGFPTFGPLPGGVPNPPGAWQEAVELQTVRALNGRAQLSPEAANFTAWLGEHGGWDIWKRFAKEYRHNAGPFRGWAGTGLMYVGMGAAALRAQVAQLGYNRMRPHEIDPGIRLLGKPSASAGYPAGTTSTAYAAASVLADLWPGRAQEFLWWARQTALSGIHSGAHFPSDVQRGAELGMQAGFAATSLLRR